MCLFCKISVKEIPSTIIYEDSDLLAFLDIAPLRPGHTLIIPKKHYESIYDCPEEILEKIIVTTKKLALEYKETYQAESCNIEVNNGAKAGQEVFHLHFHLIPKA